MRLLPRVCQSSAGSVAKCAKVCTGLVVQRPLGSTNVEREAPSGRSGLRTGRLVVQM